MNPRAKVSRVAAESPGSLILFRDSPGNVPAIVKAENIPEIIFSMTALRQRSTGCPRCDHHRICNAIPFLPSFYHFTHKARHVIIDSVLLVDECMKAMTEMRTRLFHIFRPADKDYVDMYNMSKDAADETHARHVIKFFEKVRKGLPFPPAISSLVDGMAVVADGNHRVVASAMLSIPIVLFAADQDTSNRAIIYDGDSLDDAAMAVFKRFNPDYTGGMDVVEVDTGA